MRKKFVIGITAAVLLIGGIVYAAGDLFTVSGLNILHWVNYNAPYGQSATRNAQQFQYIVLHHTGSNTSLKAAVQYGQRVDPQRGGSFGYHFYVGADGQVAQGAPLSRRTNHVSTSGRRGVSPGTQNTNSIGISAVSSGAYQQRQVESIVKLVRALQGTYGIPNERIFGHGELQFNRGTEMASVAQFIRGTAYQGESIGELISSGKLNATSNSGLFGQVQNFLGIPTSNNNTSPEVPQNAAQILQQDAQRASSGNTSSNTNNSLPPILRNTPSAAEELGSFEDDTTTSVSDTSATTGSTEQSGTTGTGSASTIHKTIVGVAPTLMCLPGPIEAGEEIMVMWSCRDDAYKAVGVGFETGNETIGATRVSPSGDTTYTVECVNNNGTEPTRSSCIVDVIEPGIGFRVTGTNTVSWLTKDMRACTLTSSAHANFSRSAIKGDDIQIPDAPGTTTLTLTCETLAGSTQVKTLEI